MLLVETEGPGSGRAARSSICLVVKTISNFFGGVVRSGSY